MEQSRMGTSIGERIRGYRLRRGLTQAVLAHLVGRSERWLIEVERGDVDLRLSDAMKLVGALGVDVADLTRDVAPGALPPGTARELGVAPSGRQLEAGPFSGRPPSGPGRRGRGT